MPHQGNLQANMPMARPTQPKWILGVSFVAAAVIVLLVAGYAKSNAEAGTDGAAATGGFFIDFTITAVIWFGITYLVLYVGWRMFRTQGVPPSPWGHDPRTRTMRDVQTLTASPRDNRRESALEIEAPCNCGLIWFSAQVRRCVAMAWKRAIGARSLWASPPGGLSCTGSAVPEDRATSPATPPGATEGTATSLSAPRSSELTLPRRRWARSRASPNTRRD